MGSGPFEGDRPAMPAAIPDRAALTVAAAPSAPYGPLHLQRLRGETDLDPRHRLRPDELIVGPEIGLPVPVEADAGRTSSDSRSRAPAIAAEPSAERVPIRSLDAGHAQKAVTRIGLRRERQRRPDRPRVQKFDGNEFSLDHIMLGFEP